MEKEKEKANRVQVIVHSKLFFGYDAIVWKKKIINNEKKEIFIADSRSTSHMVNSLKNMTNLQEVKTVVKKGNKKTMTGSFWGDLKGYEKRDDKFYPVTRKLIIGENV